MYTYGNTLVFGKGIHGKGGTEETCYLYGIGNYLQDDERDQGKYGNLRLSVGSVYRT